ncbi:MAG: tetratricopeptide repeat protein [Anaerolineales bacterium]
MPDLHIFLLGTPRIEIQDKPIHFPRRKAIALLAYLATTNRSHSRDSLATMFWPQYDQSRARANLRRELSRVKTALDEELFSNDREQVILNPGLDCWIDITAFQSRYTTARELLSNQTGDSRAEEISTIMAEIQECVGMYSGDFMAGFSLPDCPQFDEWQFFERESLQRSLNAALQDLILWKIALGEYEAAIGYARQVLTFDDLSEQAHRQLMQLYAWSGQRVSAIHQYELCANLIKGEIGVEPEEETVSLFEAIKTNQLSPPDINVLRQEAPWLASIEVSDQSQKKLHVEQVEPVDLAFQGTPFVGREREKDRLQKLLIEVPQNRLISVTGPGGVGKTRLVLETVDDIRDSFADGVYTIPLASLTSADQIVSQIAEQLNFRFTAAAGQMRELCDYLHGKHLLLVMDNFEHLMNGSALVAELLQRLPEVKILVTSRQRLNLSDEIVLPLWGMNYPEPIAGNFSKDDLSSSEAITLLVQSARRIKPGFNLAPGDLEPAARLCKLVEGIPLAIILAASWLELLSLEEILQEISQSLDFLESQAIDIPERQRSLRAVFNASWEALDDQEQETMQSLTIFQGSFSRQAALSVTKTSLQVLLRLIQKAWLQRNQDGYFQVHELQRQYVFEKLQGNKSALEAARSEHAAYYSTWLEEINQKMRGPSQGEAFNKIDSEFVNIQIAWNQLVEDEQFDILVDKFLPPIYRYSEARSKSDQLLGLVETARSALEDHSSSNVDSTGLRILLIVQASFYGKGDPIRLDRYDIMIPPAHEENIDRVGSQVGTPDDLFILGLWASLFAYLYGRFSDDQIGRDYLRQLIQEYRQANQPWELAITLQLLGGLNLAVFLDSIQRENHLEEAGRALTESLAIFERLGDSREYSYTLLLLGGYHAYRKNWDEAILNWQAAEAKFDQMGDTITSLHWLVGELLFKIGDYDTAFKYYQQFREKYLQRGHKRVAAYALSFESIHALRYSDIHHARVTREESLRLSQEVEDDFGEAWSTWEMGEIERVAGNYRDSLEWFERAMLMFRNVNETNGLIFYHRGLADLALARGDNALAKTHFEQSYEHANQLNFSWGAAYALSGLGRVEADLQDFDLALKYLSKSLDLSTKIDDAGLALLVLFTCAHLYAAQGKNGPAMEISSLVAGHFATWNEIKGQAAELSNRLRGSIPDQTRPADIERDLAELWSMVHHLLNSDFRPT